MITGKVLYTDGLNIGVMVDDGTETLCGIDRTSTNLTVREADQEPKDAKLCKPADIRAGDTVEVRGANPARAESVRIIRGTPDDLRAVREFQARKAPAVQNVNVQSVTNKDAPISLPAERLTVPDQAPPNVPYGKRREWREKEAKKSAKEQHQDVVRQTKDTEEGAGAEAGGDDDEHPDNKALKGMTKAQLQELAEREGIEITKSGTHDEHVNEIRAGRRKAARAK